MDGRTESPRRDGARAPRRFAALRDLGLLRFGEEQLLGLESQRDPGYIAGVRRREPGEVLDDGDAPEDSVAMAEKTLGSLRNRTVDVDVCSQGLQEQVALERRQIEDA